MTHLLADLRSCKHLTTQDTVLTSAFQFLVNVVAKSFGQRFMLSQRPGPAKEPQDSKILVSASLCGDWFPEALRIQTQHYRRWRQAVGNESARFLSNVEQAH
jgi:hypothetical protein